MGSLQNMVVAVLKQLIIALLAGIVVVVSIQVFSRFVLGSSSSITEELARFLLIWIGLFGGAYGYYSNAHLGLDIVTNKLSAIPHTLVAILAHLLIMGFAIVVMVLGGISLVSLTLEPVQISAAMQIKMAYVYLAIPISGGLIVFFSVVKLSELVPMLSRSKEGV
ncbi:TRAP transporter small permease [Glaciecola sp. SC05]|uniref:TRAP transporter small permease n=1 Tax=Glaciecola sp. SC05 TaxID=1987355 RepID=UPI003527331B